MPSLLLPARALITAPLLIGSVHAVDSPYTRFWCDESKDGRCVTGSKDSISLTQMHSFVQSVLSSPLPQLPQVVNASTIRNKVLAGYQGWAGARSTWDHWSNDGFKAPSPALANEHFEMVPQMGEYPAKALHATGFEYNATGSVVHLYENAAHGVVDLHFKWMRDYGLDGVLIQRFISECTRAGKALAQRNAILEQVNDAAARHGRVYAMMWDMSGATSTWDKDIERDWTTYLRRYSSHKQYLKENGRPVVCIFGIGLTDRTQATPSSSLRLIKWLQAQGLYVIGSGPYYWRTGDHDAAQGFDMVHAAFDAIMPWSVGRYTSVRDFGTKLATMQADAALASSRGQGYAPIAYPGYSYRASNKINFIKRNAGHFFGAQIDAYLSTSGVSFYYIAMFDEVQEGTAIYKFAANESESATGRRFVTASIDGIECPGDFYLTLAGQ